MRTVLHMIVEQRLTVGETERRIEKMLHAVPAPRRKTLKLFKDIRIFVNTIDHAVDTMRSAGIAADAQKRETDDYIEYTVRIPKTAGSRDPKRKTGT